jgi:CheY-like chemotaxis protein
MSNYPAILYVEDDARSARIMKMLLTGTMNLQHVNIFEESSDFIERVEALSPQPDVIFLDIHVKPYDGFEMLQMLREHPNYRKVPVVALTASVMNEEVEQLRMAGFDSCFAKPLDIDQFPDRLQRVLNGEVMWYILS